VTSFPRHPFAAEAPAVVVMVLAVLVAHARDEREARADVRPGDRLERLWVKTSQEWRPVE
jgi:hypothetical protein